MNRQIIDSHLHIELNGWTTDSLIRYLDNNAVAQGWVLTWDEMNPVAPVYYEPLDIALVEKAYRDYPDRIVPFYAPDPGRADWKEKFTRCLDLGFAGCGELKVSYSWESPVLQPLLEMLDMNHLPLVFHMERARNIFIPKSDKGADWLFKRLINERFNGEVAHHILKLWKKYGFLRNYLNKRIIDFPGYLLDFIQLEKAASTYPNITFIAHGPHIWNHFSIPEKEYLFHQEGEVTEEGLLWKILEKHENIYCDLSGYSGFNALSRDPLFSKAFLEKLSGKLLFGTDNMQLGLLDLLLKMDLQKETLDRILYRNANSILKRQ